MDELYSIGEVARRTGLSVSAIRFYSDAGIITPTAHTGAGYRRYDIRAVAGLELVRTLRELGAGLDDIRQLLAAEITLPDLAKAQLTFVERQLGQLRARRAVLRTIVREHSATEQVSLMHKLVSMSDGDRAQLIEEFWIEVTDGLDVQEFFVDHLRPRRPELPEDPTSEQLEAWIELADMVQVASFRQAVRQHFCETFAATAAHERDGTPTEEELEQQIAILTEARAASAAGLPVDSPQARELAGRWVRCVAARVSDENLTGVQRQLADADPKPHIARHSALLGRYNSLTATINDQPQPQAAGAPASTWLHAAVSALT